MILGFIFAILLGLGWGIWQYYAPAVDRAKTSSSAALSADELHRIFQMDLNVATTDWLGKTVEITGVVRSSSSSQFVLSPGIVGAWSSAQDSEFPFPGDRVTVKARIIGFDGLFDEVQMDFAVLIPEGNRGFE